MNNDRRQFADVYQQTIDIVLEGSYTSVNRKWNSLSVN